MNRTKLIVVEGVRAPVRVQQRRSSKSISIARACRPGFIAKATWNTRPTSSRWRGWTAPGSPHCSRVTLPRPASWKKMSGSRTAIISCPTARCRSSTAWCCPTISSLILRGTMSRPARGGLLPPVGRALDRVCRGRRARGRRDRIRVLLDPEPADGVDGGTRRQRGLCGAHVRRLAGTVRDLCPAVIYLYQSDLRVTLERAGGRAASGVAGVRDRLSDRASLRPGQRLSGFDGMVRFYEDRRGSNCRSCTGCRRKRWCGTTRTATGGAANWKCGRLWSGR